MTLTSVRDRAVTVNPERMLWKNKIKGLHSKPEVKVEGARLITIFGLGGTGTSTLMRLLSEVLCFPKFSTGNHFRDLAVKKYPGITADEARVKLEVDSESDSSIDLAVDLRVQEELIARKLLVCDSRLGALSLAQIIADPSRHLAVQLRCEDSIRHERVAKRDEITPEEAEKRNHNREGSIARRYPNSYGIGLENLVDWRHYNVIIDSGVLSPKEIAQAVLNAIPYDWGLAHMRMPEGEICRQLKALELKP